MDKIRKLLGFPYPREYEADFNRNLMKTMHKPLLIAVIGIMMFVTWLVWLYTSVPEEMGPPQYTQGILTINFVFMLFTLVTLLIVVAFRRQLFLYPRLHLMLCNTYAIGICAWASVLSAYANYSAAIYIAFIVVTLCASMVSLFKPWMAVLVFSANYLLYFLLFRAFLPEPTGEQVALLYSGALAAIVGTVIATAFYRFRVKNYYDRLVIAGQMEEIQRINDQLQQLVHIDNLTGLFNRRYYDEKMHDRLREMLRGDGICCIMVDIDFFKRYNDSYGHPAGDQCLRTVAAILKGGADAGGGVAVRYGGEEFLLLTQAAGVQQAEALAHSLRQAVEDAYLPNAASPFGKVTISAGLVFRPKGSPCDLSALTKQADDALYHSKQNGRNGVTLG